MTTALPASLAPATGPRRWWQSVQRQWQLRQLTDPAFAFLFDPPPPDEWVSLDC